MRHRRLLSAALLLVVLAPLGRAQSVELSPFAGYQFARSSYAPGLESTASLEGALDWGAVLDVPFAANWRVEVLYAREEPDLFVARGGGRIPVTVERYLAGVVEEKGDERTRFFGSGLIGATRFVPSLDGYGSDTRFTLTLGLGVKRYLSARFALRAEARGYYAFSSTGGGILCNQGNCLFAFSGDGLFQGSVSGGVVFVF